MQDRGAPAEGDVDESAHRGPAGNAFRPAFPAPGVGIVGGGAAFEDCVIDVGSLSCDGEVEGVEEAERVEIRGREARLVHVEVFRMESVRTSIFREASTSTRATTRADSQTRAVHPQLRRATYIDAADRPGWDG